MLVALQPMFLVELSRRAMLCFTAPRKVARLVSALQVCSKKCSVPNTMVHNHRRNKVIVDHSEGCGNPALAVPDQAGPVPPADAGNAVSTDNQGADTQ